MGSSSPAAHEEQRGRPTPKRSISNLITELREAQGTMQPIPEPIVLTAPQIAATYFERELARHGAATAKTIVLLHDACYGHRFSRPKTTKSMLSMIVERPERIHASALGAATAYVRLGGHHAGARHAPHPKHATSSPPPFKLRRTGRSLDITSSYVTNVHGTAWMSELHTLCETAGAKLVAGEKEVARAPSPSGVEKRTLHEGDLYLCQESLDAFQGALGGVADAVDSVFIPAQATRRAFVAVRPPGHHCSADYPSGFCWINNVHVGIEYAAQTYGLTHAAIIDFDLHHGDGSQTIAWQRNSKNNLKRLNAKANAKVKLGPDIGYYSLHDINSYPCEMGDDEKVQAASLCVHNAHGQSIWNVHLQPWKTIEEFWSLYETRYKVVLDKARDFLSHAAKIKTDSKQQPKAAIFISAGFDASEWEGEGMQRHEVNVPTEFYARFTRDIVQLAGEAGTACDGRVISVLEGGYSDRALCSGVLSHLSALSLPTSSTPAPADQAMSSLDLSMRTGALPPQQLHQQMRALSLSKEDNEAYDPAWWSAANLTALEHHINPPPPPTAGGKRARGGPQPTYATPTESFAYKVIDPAKFARSISGTLREGAPVARPITPPPPEVDWIIAAHELSKLLIPAGRITKSCTAEDLAGPKVKKEHTPEVALTGLGDEAGKARQLRTRAKAAPAARGHAPAGPARSVSSGDRRRTIAELPSASTGADAEPVQRQRRPSRRSSMVTDAITSSAALDVGVPPVPALPPTATVGAVRPRPGQPAPAPPSVGIQIKKTRVLPAGEGLEPRRASANSAPISPAFPIQPASSVSTSTDGTINDPDSVRTTASTAPSTANEGGVDALASGLKRISLKFNSREESERRAKEKLDAERRARALKGAETRRINKAAREAKAVEEKKAAPAPLPVPKMGNQVQVQVDGAAPPLTQPRPLVAAPPLTVSDADGSAPSAPATVMREATRLPQPERPVYAEPAPPSMAPSIPVNVNASLPSISRSAAPTESSFQPQPSLGLPFDPVRDSSSTQAPLNGSSSPVESHPPAGAVQTAPAFATSHPSVLPASASSLTPTSLPPVPPAFAPSPMPTVASPARDLPTFTSTGHIPFAAPRPSVGATLASAARPSDGAFEYQQPSGSASQLNGVGGGANESSLAHTKTAQVTKEAAEDAGGWKQGQAGDIWTVPDTPAK